MTNYDAANPLALRGCPAAGNMDWSALFVFVGVMMVFYSLIMYLSPYKLFPSEGIYKYAWLTWYAGIKENDANSDRGVYDAWTGGMQHMNGVMFFASGLFSLWASSDSEGFTFFTVCVIYSVVALLTFVQVVATNFDKYSPMCYSWGVMFLICVILSSAVLAAQDSDAKQLSSASEGSGLSAGGVLWFFAIFHILGAVQALVTTFDSMERFGAQLYLKEDYESTKFGKGIQRMNAAAGFGLAAIFLWAAMNHGKDVIDQGEGFPLPVAMIVGFVAMTIFGIVEFVIYGVGYYEEFAILQMGVLMGSNLAALIVGYQISCNV